MNSDDSIDHPKNLPDRYEVVTHLGTGGMGIVYKVHDKLLSKDVALKLLTDISNNSRLRFQGEAKAIAKLKHINIPEIYDFGITVDQKPYMVMEYLEGVCLASLLKTGQKFPYKEAIPIFLQICEALQYSHQNDVIHRDVKPSNIILLNDENGKTRVKVIDFGLAKITSTNQSLTGTGVGIGTPNYMSPEQIRAEQIDERTDIYSLGCLVYEVLTGKAPFRGATSLEIIDSHLHKKAAPIKKSLGVSPRLEQVIEKCLQKEREQRYSSVQEVIDELSFVLSTQDSDDNSGNLVTTEISSSSNSQQEVTKKSWFAPFVLGVVIFGVCALVLKFSEPEKSDTTPHKKVRKSVPYNTAEVNIPRDLPKKVPSKEMFNPQAKSLTLKSDKIEFDFIEKMKLLEQLTISHELPKEKDQVIDLEHLQARPHEDISASDLEKLTHLRKLKSVTFKRIILKDDALQEISRIQSIETFHLNDGKGLFTADGVKAIASMSNLKTLELSACGLNDKEVELLSGLKLDYLQINRNPQVSAIGLKYLQKIRTLRYLAVQCPDDATDGNAYYDTLGSFEHLKILQIRNAELDKIQALNNLKLDLLTFEKSVTIPNKQILFSINSKKVKFDHCRLGYSLFESLKNSSITELELEKSEVDPIGLSLLSKSKTLKRLTLINTPVPDIETLKKRLLPVKLRSIERNTRTSQLL